MNSNEPINPHDSSETVSRLQADQPLSQATDVDHVEDPARDDSQTQYSVPSDGVSENEGLGIRLAPGDGPDDEDPDIVEPEARTVIRGGSSRRQSTPALPSSDRTPAGVAKVLLGSQLNHFRLDALIGGGGMGAVFRAHDQQLDRTVAIKVIPFVGEDPDLNRRFRNEAQNAAKLDHPNIARVFDVGSYEDWHYIVFEYVEGTNIRDRVLRDGPLSIDDAVFATCQLADAIGHAAGRGIVHRDIKPSNVVINLEEQIKLVDMGLARSESVELSEDMTASGVTLGTFDYISPEQALDPRKADICSDIYSLGCTFYFMLTGQPPYPGGTMLQKLMSHGNAPPPDPRLLRNEITEDLVAVVQRLLAKAPKDRYQTVKDLVLDLQELAAREGLVRALSLTTSTNASERNVVRGWERYVPWGVAISLLLGGAIALQAASQWSGAEEIPVSIGGVPIPDRLAMSRDDLANGALIDGKLGTAPADRQRQTESPQVAAPGPSGAAVADQEAVPIPVGGSLIPDSNALDLPTFGVQDIVGDGLNDRVSPASEPFAIDAFGSSGAASGLSDTLSSNGMASPLEMSTESAAATPGLESGFTASNDTAEADGRFGSSTFAPRSNVAPPTPIPFDVVPPTAVRVVDRYSLPSGIESLDGLDVLRDVSLEGIAFVATLDEALTICEQQACDRIELATPSMVSGPIRITRPDLQIISVAGRTSLRLQSPDLLSMERAKLVSVLTDRVEFVGIDFHWNVPASEPNGGSVFSLTENRMFRMMDCTVTVRNPAERNEVRAFEIVTDPEVVAREFDNETVVRDGREMYEEFSSIGPAQLPLVAIELENVIVRGEMTMVQLDYAVELQLKWTNGLLAISERMIDTAGALDDVAITAPPMQVELSRLTASIPKGLFRMRLGNAGRYPVALDRQAERCVFIVDSGMPQMLVTGLRESRSIRSLVQIRGTSNAYPYPSTDLQEPLLMIDDRNGGQEIVLLESLVSDEPEWSREESPRWSVRWSTDPLSDDPPSELLPADFRQDGSISVGFNEQALPRISASERSLGAGEELE